MPRTSTTAEDRILALPKRATFVRVRIEDADNVMRNVHNLYGRDYFLGLSLSDDIDRQMATCDIRLRRDFFDYSLAREHQTSRINLDAAGVYAPLLDLNRRVSIHTSVQPYGSTAVPNGSWREMFDGNIHQIDDGTDTITLSVRDRISGHLMDRWIETNDGVANLYSSALPGTAVETVMQSIIDDWTDAGVGIDLYTPVSPNWQILEYPAAVGPVMDELQRLAAQIGWVCKVRWDETTARWRLTLFDPDRTKVTPDVTYTSDQLIGYSKHGIDMSMIRNYINVVWGDPVAVPNPNENIDPESGRRVETRTDSDSITQFGRQYMQVAEETGSNITTQAEAQLFGDIILGDLANPTAMESVRVPFDWRPLSSDLIRIPADGRIETSASDLGCTGYSHNITPDTAITEIHLRGAPASSFHTHVDDRQARPGGAAALNVNLPAIPVVEAAPAPGGTIVTMTYSPNKDFDSHEVYAGTVGTFTPSLANQVARTRGKYQFVHGPPGETQYIRTMAVDRFGNRSLASTGSAVSHGQMGIQYLDPQIDFGGTWDRGFGVQSRGLTYPPDGWDMVTGTWDTDASRGTSPIESGDYSLSFLTATTEMSSRYFAAQNTYPYQFLVRWQSTGTVDTATFRVEWHTSQGSVISTDNIAAAVSATAADTWESAQAVLTSPATARWARVLARLDTGAVDDMIIDRVEFQRTLHSFRAYLASSRNVGANGTWEALGADTESFDHGAWYDHSGNERVDIAEPGLYIFGATLSMTVADTAAGVAVYVNGSRVAGQTADTANVDALSGGVMLNCSTGFIQLAAGDYVEAYVVGDDSAGTANITGGTAASFFWGNRIS